jgi:anti-anti-sigma factor
MKRHLTASAVSIGGQKEGGAGRARTETSTALGESARARASGKPSLVLASTTVWTHTLVLTGELDHRSAHTLELEIERLCDEGVSGIRLDLRGLTRVDEVGVAVIAYRSGLCRRRGHDFRLLAVPPHIQDALERGRVTQRLAFSNDDEVASLSAPAENTVPAESHGVVRSPAPGRKARIPQPRLSS